MVKLLKSIYIASDPGEISLSAGWIKHKMIEKYPLVSVFDHSDASRRANNSAADRRETVEKMDNSSEVLIAVIDKNWTSGKNRLGKKKLGLHDPRNLDHIAIATALKGNTPVMPVLVNGASMPKADALPNDLGPLTLIAPSKVGGSSWDLDIRILVSKAGRYVGQEDPLQRSIREFSEGKRSSESQRTKSEVSPSEAVREPKPTQLDPTQADTLLPETIFISYSRKDWDDFVKPLVFDFRQRGLKAWIDQQGIRSGTDWSDAIDKALRTCQRMVVCVSPNSMESEQVKREYRFFLHKNKTVVPLLCREADNTPYDLDTIQYIPYEYRSKLVEELLG